VGKVWKEKKQDENKKTRFFFLKRVDKSGFSIEEKRAAILLAIVFFFL